MLNMIGSVFVGATMVGGDKVAVTGGGTDSLGGTAHAQTRTTGTLTMAYQFTGTVLTRTSVTNRGFIIILKGTINGATTIASVTMTTSLTGGTARGKTVLTSDITIERERILLLFGNSGVAVDKSLVAHGSATAGTGIRQIGPPVDLPEKVSRLATYYV